MATELLFTRILDLPRHPLGNLQKHRLRLPSQLPLTVSSGHRRCRTIFPALKSKSNSLIVNAVSEEVVQIPNSDSQTASPSSSKLVLVIGGSGGVGTYLLVFLVRFSVYSSIWCCKSWRAVSFVSGQLVVASLLSRNIKSRLLLRDPAKATTLFGEQDEEALQVPYILCIFIEVWQSHC